MQVLNTAVCLPDACSALMQIWEGDQAALPAVQMQSTRQSMAAMTQLGDPNTAAVCLFVPLEQISCGGSTYDVPAIP